MAKGLRNPFRLAIDKWGGVAIANVGWNARDVSQPLSRDVSIALNMCVCMYTYLERERCVCTPHTLGVDV